MKRMIILLAPLALAATTFAVAAPAAAYPSTGTESTTVEAAAGPTGPGVASGPAPTAAKATKCPKGWFCVWPKTSYRPANRWLGGTKRGTCYTPFEQGRSVSNQIGKTIRVFSRTGCKGAYFDLKTGYGSSRTPFNVRSVRT